MPNWTNFHHKEAFMALSDSLRKDFQWNSIDLMLLELLARYCKTPLVTVKAFTNAIPEKYLKSVQPNERSGLVHGFFAKL